MSSGLLTLPWETSRAKASIWLFRNLSCFLKAILVLASMLFLIGKTINKNNYNAHEDTSNMSSTFEIKPIMGILF